MDRLYVPEEQLMHRFYADPGRSADGIVYLTPEDAHHALDVLRMRAGEPAEVIDQGLRFRASVASMENGEVILRKEELLPSTETAVSFTLFQGLPKGDKMDLIVQKAVELGASRIVPVVMARCIVKMNEKDAARKTERWQKIAREAGKQSGRCIIPEVALPCPLSRISGLLSSLQQTVVPWEMSRSYGPRAFAGEHPDLRSLGIVIGPEGGISEEEIAFLSSLGVTPVTLGKRILRTETAGLAALSAFSALYGEME